MGQFRDSYKEYHLKKHGEKWAGNLLDKFFLNDLKESIE